MSRIFRRFFVLLLGIEALACLATSSALAGDDLLVLNGIDNTLSSIDLTKGETSLGLANFAGFLYGIQNGRAIVAPQADHRGHLRVFNKRI